MVKIVIQVDQNVQEIIEVGQGGYYNDISKVLWDERLDGPLDISFAKPNLGGLVKNGNKLELNQSKLDAANVFKAQKDSEFQAESQKKQDQKTAKQGLKSKINSISNINDVKDVLKEFVKALRADE